MLTDKDREWLAAVTSDRRQRTPLRLIRKAINWEIFIGFLVVLGFLGYVLYQGQDAAVTPATVAFVLVGWVFSLCLHEFAHAATAVLGGDNSDGTLRYLSFNPLNYVNFFTSILLPLIFILLGGIGLPGGAVYINRGRLRSRGWESLVSLAGPLMNLICAFLLALPFLFLPNVIGVHPALANALAVLAYFQVFAALLNLLPIPPLDGFGVIAPYLSRQAQATAYSIGSFSIIILFILLWEVPAAFTALNVAIFFVLGVLGHIDPIPVYYGLNTLFFWKSSF